MATAGLTPPVITSITPTSGTTAGGTVVTITGSGFSGTSVNFGSTPAASITVESDTKILAVTPPHAAGTVGVTVTTTRGTSNAVPFTFSDTAPTITTLTPTSGPVTGGTAVNLTGTHFTGVTAVNFGSTPASSFTVNSDTSITATAPAGVAGPVSVSVTNPSGTSNAVTYTYSSSSTAPAITSLSPTLGSLTGGTSVNITGTGFTGATSVFFGGTPATTFTINSDTSITAESPAGTGSVNVTVVGPGGVSNPSTFTYMAVPVISAISPTNGPAAGGTSVTITGSGLTGTTAVSFGGTPAASFIVNSDTSITAVSPAHAAGSVFVNVTTPVSSSNILPFIFT